MPNQYHNLGWLLITLSNYRTVNRLLLSERLGGVGESSKFSMRWFFRES